jgi:hypothetical protein
LTFEGAAAGALIAAETIDHCCEPLRFAVLVWLPLAVAVLYSQIDENPAVGFVPIAVSPVPTLDPELTGKQ